MCSPIGIISQHTRMYWLWYYQSYNHISSIPSLLFPFLMISNAPDITMIAATTATTRKANTPPTAPNISLWDPVTETWVEGFEVFLFWGWCSCKWVRWVYMYSDQKNRKQNRHGQHFTESKQEFDYVYNYITIAKYLWLLYALLLSSYPHSLSHTLLRTHMHTHIHTHTRWHTHGGTPNKVNLGSKWVHTQLFPTSTVMCSMLNYCKKKLRTCTLAWKPNQAPL